jgi:hypothetical protein
MTFQKMPVRTSFRTVRCPYSYCGKPHGQHAMCSIHSTTGNLANAPMHEHCTRNQVNKCHGFHDWFIWQIFVLGYICQGLSCSFDSIPTTRILRRRCRRRYRVILTVYAYHSLVCSSRVNEWWECNNSRLDKETLASPLTCVTCNDCRRDADKWPTFVYEHRSYDVTSSIQQR